MTEETITEVTEPDETKEEPKVETKIEKPTKSAKVAVIRDQNDAILELRHENADLRKRLDSIANDKAEELAKDRIEIAKSEAKAEAQHLLETKLSELEEKSRSRIVKTELKSAALRAGCVDFDDLYEIMKRDVLKKIEFSEDGDVTNAGDLIRDIKEAKPHMFAAISTSSATPAPVSRQTADMPSVMNLPPDEYRKARQKLMQM